MLLADATSSLSEWLAGYTDIIVKAALGSGDVDFIELLNRINFDLAENITGKQTPQIFSSPLLNSNYPMHQTTFSYLIAFLFTSILLSASSEMLVLMSNSWVI